MRLVLALSSLVVLTLVASCARSATQLVVTVSSDLPTSTIGCVGVLVSPVDGTTVAPGTSRFFAVPADAELPLSFGVVPPSGDSSRRVQVSVEALPTCAAPAPSDLVVRSTVRTGFLDGLALRLPLALSASCGMGCPSTETCPASGATCVAVPSIDPSELSLDESRSSPFGGTTETIFVP